VAANCSLSPRNSLRWRQTGYWTRRDRPLAAATNRRAGAVAAGPRRAAHAIGVGWRQIPSVGFRAVDVATPDRAAVPSTLTTARRGALNRIPRDGPRRRRIGRTGLLAWTFKRSAPADLKDAIAGRGAAVKGREVPGQSHRTRHPAGEAGPGIRLDSRRSDLPTTPTPPRLLRQIVLAPRCDASAGWRRASTRTR